MKLKIDLKILFFLVLFYFTKQIHIYILIMLFAFLHELSHILLARILKFKVYEILVMPFGFSTEIEANVEDYNIKIGKSNLVELKKIFVVAVGPISNLIFSIILLILNRFIEISNLDILVYCNILIFIFNIIPFYPLDGGRLLKSILKIGFGYEKAIKITKKITYYTIIIFSIICCILVLWLKNIAIFVIIIYLWKLKNE